MAKSSLRSLSLHVSSDRTIIITFLLFNSTISLSQPHRDVAQGVYGHTMELVHVIGNVYGSTGRLHYTLDERASRELYGA
jgi:hypothetical protein